MCGPRSLRIRMWMGFWPPSKPTLRLLPEREPAPFWPRPAVLPTPEPSPRPTRLRGRREPRAGLRLCRPTLGLALSAIAHLHQVLDRADLPAHGRLVGTFRRLADAPEAKAAQGLLLLAAGAVRRANLPDLERVGHQAEVSSLGAASSVGAAFSRSSIPSTSLTVSPRSCATSSGRRRDSSALTVAFTKLIGFWLPSDFESTSWMPASS